LIKRLGANAKLIENDWHNTHKSQKMTNSKKVFFYLNLIFPNTLAAASTLAGLADWSSSPVGVGLFIWSQSYKTFLFRKLWIFVLS
jgi:hypothetical protein